MTKRLAFLALVAAAFVAFSALGANAYAQSLAGSGDGASGTPYGSVSVANTFGDGDITPQALSDWTDAGDHWEYTPGGSGAPVAVTSWVTASGQQGLKDALDAVPTPAAGQAGAYDENKPYVILVGNSAGGAGQAITFAKTYTLAGKNVELRNAVSTTDEAQKMRLFVEDKYRHFITSGVANKLVLKNIALDGGIDYETAKTMATNFTKGGFNVINTVFTFSGEITHCISLTFGGAIRLNEGSTLNLYDSKIIENLAIGTAYGHGGGISTADLQNRQSIRIWGNTQIRRNFAQYYGGGIFIDNFVNDDGSASLGISGNTIIDGNEAELGGGITSRVSDVTLRDNVQVTNNSAKWLGFPGNQQYPGVGGGIMLDQWKKTNSSTLEIRDNVKISGNTAERAGGGIAATIIRDMANTPNMPAIILKGGEISNNVVSGDTRTLSGNYSQRQVDEIGSGGGILAPEQTKVIIPANSTVKFFGNWAPFPTVLTRARLLQGGALSGVTDNYTSHIAADPNVTGNSMTTNPDYNHLYNNYDISLIAKNLVPNAGASWAKITLQPGAGGQISQTDAQIASYSTILGTGTTAAKVGQNLQYVAVPDPGYRFKGWTAAAATEAAGATNAYNCGTPLNTASYCSIPNLALSEWTTALAGTTFGNNTNSLAARTLKLAMPPVEVTLTPQFEKLADLAGVTGPSDNGSGWNFSAMNTTVKTAGVAGDYTQPAAQTVTITNASGGLDATAVTVTKSGTNAANFTLAGPTPTGTTLASGASKAWTIQPNAGLAVGVYTATLTLSYNDGVAVQTKTGQVRFEVTNPSLPPIIQQDGGLPSFPAVRGASYIAPNSQSLSVINNGQTPADNMQLSCANFAGTIKDGSTVNVAVFDCESTVISGISPGGGYGFSVRPLPGLAPGEYKSVATVNYSWLEDSSAGVAAGSDSLSVELTFTVHTPASLTSYVADNGAFGVAGIQYLSGGVKSITFTNLGQTAATILSVTGATGDYSNFNVTENGNSVPGGAAMNNWTVSPINGLGGGDYEAEFIVGYFDGTTGATPTTANKFVTFKVSFTVVSHRVDFVSGTSELVGTAPCYSVEFGKDGTETLPTMAAITSAASSCDRSGYSFVGWSTSPSPAYNATVSYADGATNYPIVDLINSGVPQVRRLYAIWKLNVTIKFWDGFAADTTAHPSGCTTAQYLSGGCTLANSGKGNLLDFYSPNRFEDGVSLPGVFKEGDTYAISGPNVLEMMNNAALHSGWYIPAGEASIIDGSINDLFTAYSLDRAEVDIVLNWKPIEYTVKAIYSYGTAPGTTTLPAWPTDIATSGKFGAVVDADTFTYSTYAGLPITLGDDPTRVGYDFAGWTLEECTAMAACNGAGAAGAYGAGGTTASGTTLTAGWTMPQKNVVLRSTWTPKTRLFNWLDGAPSNGGDSHNYNAALWAENAKSGDTTFAADLQAAMTSAAPTTPDYLQVGTTYTAPAALSPFEYGDTKYEFVQWCSDLTGVCFAPGSTRTVPALDEATTQIVAVWRAGSQAVSYSTGYGAFATGDDPDMFEEPVGQFISITDKEPERKGYTFAGWSVSSNDLALSPNVNGGNYQYNALCMPANAQDLGCGFVMPARSVRLEAVWVANAVSLGYALPTGSAIGAGFVIVCLMQ